MWKRCWTDWLLPGVPSDCSSLKEGTTRFAPVVSWRTGIALCAPIWLCIAPFRQACWHCWLSGTIIASRLVVLMLICLLYNALRLIIEKPIGSPPLAIFLLLLDCSICHIHLNHARYQKGNKAIHRAELLNESDYTIMATYQLEYRVIANYYHCAYSMEVLNSLQWTMEQSLTKTLANKHKTTVADIYTRYKTHLNVDGKTYKVLQATVPREGKKQLVATRGAIPLQREVKTPVEEQPQRQL